MRHVLFAFVLFSLPLMAAPVPKERKKGTVIFGTWRVQEGNTETWVFGEDGNAKYGNNYPNYTGKAVFTVDESVTPHTINWSQDPQQKSWNLGIYEYVDGKLTINFASPGRERPKTMTEQAGARIVSFKRFEE